jgi:hypothetical protein
MSGFTIAIGRELTAHLNLLMLQRTESKSKLPKIQPNFSYYIASSSEICTQDQVRYLKDIQHNKTISNKLD